MLTWYYYSIKIQNTPSNWNCLWFLWWTIQLQMLHVLCHTPNSNLTMGHGMVEKIRWQRGIGAHSYMNEFMDWVKMQNIMIWIIITVAFCRWQDRLHQKWSVKAYQHERFQKLGQIHLIKERNLPKDLRSKCN